MAKFIYKVYEIERVFRGEEYGTGVTHSYPIPPGFSIPGYAYIELREKSGTQGEPVLWGKTTLVTENYLGFSVYKYWGLHGYSRLSIESKTSNEAIVRETFYEVVYSHSVPGYYRHEVEGAYNQYPKNSEDVTGSYWYIRDRLNESIVLTKPIGGEIVNTLFNIEFEKTSANTTTDIELSVNNGGNWTRIASDISGSSYEYDFKNIPQGANNRIRVRTGYDGTYTDWTMSGIFSVIHNYVPTIPSSIDILGLRSGLDTTISWGESTDLDGDTLTYSLERSVNGGSYVVIYTGNNLSFTELIESNWNNLKYQVRAYDGKVYSGYRTSQLLEVIHNLPPTIPSSITVPTLRINTTAVINWGISTDEDGDTITYHLERSANGGSYSSIYNGSNRSYTDSIGSWQNVRYRVRAYDTKVYSDYRTSSLINIIQNIVPTVPSSITVPELRSGLPSSISWGASTDEDGDPVTYQLQRSVNSGTWQNAYTGGDLSYSDTPLRNWNTVIYRVRAYDTKEYSGFRTGATITVKHFPLVKYKKNGVLYTGIQGWIKEDGVLKQVGAFRYKIDNELKEV